jgi:4'-phosphopantetheinyl transferase
MSIPRLNAGDVHVWQASLDRSADEFQELKAFLNEDDISRADRFHAEEDRQHYVVSRGILRAILSDYLSISPEQVRFVYGTEGKPALHDSWSHTRISFNLSHSKQFALYAVAADREVGIDVEWIQPSINFRQLAEHFFTPGEIALLRTLPHKEGLARFYATWTCKEALLKAVGMGLSLSLDQFTVSFPDDQAAVALFSSSKENSPIDPSRWSLYRLKAPPHYAAALAVEGKLAGLTLLPWLDAGRPR